jgi:precorrin-3B methylase
MFSSNFSRPALTLNWRHHQAVAQEPEIQIVPGFCVTAYGDARLGSELVAI